MTHQPQHIGAVGNYVVQEYAYFGEYFGNVWVSCTPEFTSLASAEQAAMVLKSGSTNEFRVVRRLENGISQGLFTA